jgi:microcystin-dependent protein
MHFLNRPTFPAVFIVAVILLLKLQTSCAQVNPYVGEIRVFAGNFAPSGWEFCYGQLVSIAEFETLFNLIGTTYGGDGQSTFALPDLRSRIPIHADAVTAQLGETGGTETVTLTNSQIPSHTHAVVADMSGNSENPANANLAGSPMTNVYQDYSSPSAVTMNANTIGTAGGSQPHDNMPPYLAVNYIISMYGIYPTPP